jgi:hypothetical protein
MVVIDRRRVIIYIYYTADNTYYTFEENKNVANRGGNVAGIARKQTEKELGHSVISSENYLEKLESEDGTLPKN